MKALFSLKKSKLEEAIDVLLMICFAILLIMPQFIYISSAGGYDDSDLKEVGVECMQDYPSDDLSWSYTNAYGFYQRLGEKGWTKRYMYVNNPAAQENHFEHPWYGGNYYIYTGYNDFAFFAGHGAPENFNFGYNWDGDGSYTTYVHYTEARNWGLGDLEWITLCACSVLKNDWDPNVFNRWGWPTFCHLHAITGFATNAQDKPYWILWPFLYTSAGTVYVDWMTTSGYTVGGAWKRTTIDWQDSMVYGAYLCVYNPSTGYYGSNDYLPGYGTVGPDLNPPPALYWSHWQC